ncbi:hypothetical protein ACVIJW_002626 [Bradyrhizobium barranii subsp. barranii]
MARRQIWAKDELSFQTARFQTPVRLSNFSEGDSLGNAWLNGASRQHFEEPRQIFAEPGRMSRPHQIDRVEVDPPAAGQPPQYI